MNLNTKKFNQHGAVIDQSLEFVSERYINLLI